MSRPEDEDRGGSQAQIRLGAELSALRDLLAVMAHDLSNPLQSLTLLLEICVLDMPPADPMVEKLEQSLGAAKRMRMMVRDLSEFARGAGQRATVLTFDAAVDRCMGVLARRFERQAISPTRDLGTTGSMEIPDPVDAAAFQSALLNALLGTIARAGESGCLEHELSIVGPGPGRLQVEFAGIADDKTRSPLELSEEYRQRVVDAALGTRVRIEGGAGTLAIVLAPPGA